MALQDLLNRLRPVGAPGPAGPVAVPAEEEDRAAAELAPVFAALAETAAEADAVRRSATDRAAATTAEAEREAASLVANATSRASAERAAAAARVHASGEEEAAALLAEAKQQAARLKEDSGPRLDELTDLVIANLREHITATDSGPMQVAR
ncbi:MAG TPA: hypothetical protein VFZ37_19735 [Jiangellaceae bacterium]